MTSDQVGKFSCTMATLNEYICQLSEEEKAYVRDNLNECDETRPIKIAEIKQWITENEELHVPADDFVILRFLRACKFNTEKAKCKLRNYYKQRACVPEWYSNRDPFLPELQELFDLGHEITFYVDMLATFDKLEHAFSQLVIISVSTQVLLPLRKLDNEGRMIVIVRTAVHTPSRHKMSDMLKVALMTLDLALRDHESVTIYGITAILDIGGMTYEHVLQLPPNVIKNLVHAWQGCYPVRIHSLNFINAHKFVNAVLNIFRSFMITKLKQRVHVHARGKLKLYETLPISILPVEYGGTDGTVKELSEYWKRTVKENSKWFAEEENYKLMLIK